jgi:lipoprotein-anchoring transpeptidase ErfK/SrfK
MHEVKMTAGSKGLAKVSLAVLAALFVLTTAHAPTFAQSAASIEAAKKEKEMQIDEQPGHEPTVEEGELPDVYRRQEVFFRTSEPAGTVIIRTSDRFLYLIIGPNRALRYAIGVGRQGFQWSGLERISRKQEWPDWRPPPEMIDRQPYLPRFMAGGPGNPLGARALYLGNTDYRIHGTNLPETIGQAISSGCFRLVNDDVIDLFDRIPIGTRVIIKQAAQL